MSDQGYLGQIKRDVIESRQEKERKVAEANRAINKHFAEHDPKVIKLLLEFIAFLQGNWTISRDIKYFRYKRDKHNVLRATGGEIFWYVVPNGPEYKRATGHECILCIMLCINVTIATEGHANPEQFFISSPLVPEEEISTEKKYPPLFPQVTDIPTKIAALFGDDLVVLEQLGYLKEHLE